MCVLPVRSDDALSNSVSYLVENVFVVCTADEELILKDKTTNTSPNEQQLSCILVPSHIFTQKNGKMIFMCQIQSSTAFL